MAPPSVELVGVVHRTPLDGTPSVVADLRDPAAAAAAVRSAAPDLVLHAAYSKDEASIVRATTHLTTAARHHGARLVHLSTEAVFAGTGRPRSEAADPDPVADYGRWKAASERVVAVGLPTAAVVRLPLLVSTDPPDATLARLAGLPEGATCRWFLGERRQAAWAQDVAAALWRLVDLDDADRAGVWHLPGPVSLTREQLGRRQAALAGRPDLRHVVVPPPDTPRPADLVLTGERARRAVGWAPRRVEAD